MTGKMFYLFCGAKLHIFFQIVQVFLNKCAFFANLLYNGIIFSSFFVLLQHQL